MCVRSRVSTCDHHNTSEHVCDHKVSMCVCKQSECDQKVSEHVCVCDHKVSEHVVCVCERGPPGAGSRGEQA